MTANVLQMSLRPGMFAHFCQHDSRRMSKVCQLQFRMHPRCCAISVYIATVAAPDRIVHADEKINGSEAIATNSKKIEVAAQSADVWFRSGAWGRLCHGPVHQSGRKMPEGAGSLAALQCARAGCHQHDCEFCDPLDDGPQSVAERTEKGGGEFVRFGSAGS